MLNNKKPRLLDLYCGAGGAAMGYHRAGFDVVGIDIKPQPNYPFPIMECDAIDALDWLINGKMLRFKKDGHMVILDKNDIDVYHASPPCQFASTIAKQNRILRPDVYCHPNLIPQTRARVISIGKPYILENVPPAREFMIAPVGLCGSWFGLDLHRHRYFESNILFMGTPCSHYWQKPRFRTVDKRRNGKLASVVRVNGHIDYSGQSELRQKAMGIDWMNDYELTQAIPPAYTEYIGKIMMRFAQ